MLLRADGPCERQLVAAVGGLAAEQQPLRLVTRHELAGRLDQPLREPQPVERFARDEVRV